jgi:hypothetical protein
MLYLGKQYIIMKRFLLLLGITMLISCSGENSPSPEPTPDQSQLRIKEVKTESKTLETYEYDSENRVTQYIQYKYNRPEFTYNYSYQNDTTYTEVILSGEIYMRDEKSFRLDDKTVRIERYVNESFTGASEYTWDGNSCSYSTITIFSGNIGDSVVHCVFEGDTCNEKRRGLNSLDSRFALDIYRDGMNAYDVAAVPQPMTEAPGNPITYLYYKTAYLYSTEEDFEINPEMSYDSEFVYNDASYPISETRTYRDGKFQIMTFEYY